MENGRITLIEEGMTSLEDGKKYVGAFSSAQVEQYADLFGIDSAMLQKSISNSSTRFESHEGLDVICVPLIEIASMNPKVRTMHVFIQKDRFCIVCEEPLFVQKIMKQISEDCSTDISFGKLLFDFFEELIKGDSAHLDRFEEKIMALENEVIIDKKRKNYVSRIMHYRKHLVQIRRYYEQLISVFNYIGLNENGLFDRHSLKLLKILAGEITRLHSNVLILQEYIAQIIEAYQAEVDISLNKTMKVFTVVTTIFLPPTLIAGWYGMNFDMPEYHSVFGYPAVILLSLAVVGFTIGYFKRNKWF